MTGAGAGAQSSTFTVLPEQQAMIVNNATMVTDRKWDFTNAWHWLEGGAWILALAVIVGFAALLLLKFYKGTIDLRHLISEADGKASLSRFQALMFTFVFVIALALIVVRTGQFPIDVPLGVWALLGGSLGTYLISKGLQSGMSPAAAGVPADFAPGGPMTRYGTDADTLLPTLAPTTLASRRQAGSALSRLLLPAGHSSFSEPVTIATVIGGTSITITPLPVPGVTVKGKVWFREAGPAGAVIEAEKEFAGETKVTTAPGEITEVRVAFLADREKVVVPVKVQQV